MILESYNIDSITDNGTGDYRANFIVSPANANYCSVISATIEQHVVPFVGANSAQGGAVNNVNYVDIVCINVTNSGLRQNCKIHLVVFA